MLHAGKLHIHVQSMDALSTQSTISDLLDNEQSLRIQVLVGTFVIQVYLRAK